ncbi:zf-HC2 domain-containing protein, partial [Burkholderia pseudomallei]
LLGKCKDITRLLSDDLDRPPSLDERLRVRVHLPACTGCRNYRMQLRMLREAARVAGGTNGPRTE